MSYKMLGSARKYVHFSIRNAHNFNDVRAVITLYGISEEGLSNDNESEEIVLENGELCIAFNGFRQSCNVTLYNIKNAQCQASSYYYEPEDTENSNRKYLHNDAEKIKKLQYHLEQSLRGNSLIILYPEYNPDYAWQTQRYFTVYPVGNITREWQNPNVDTMQTFNIQFKSIRYHSLEEKILLTHNEFSNNYQSAGFGYASNPN